MRSPQSPDTILQEVERFLRETDVKASRLGRAAASDPTLVYEMRGGRIPRAGTVAKLRAYMQEYRNSIRDEVADAS